MFFDNTTIEIFTYTPGIDDYGNTDNYEFRESVPADIQPVNPISTYREFGKILQDTYNLYLQEDVEIHDTDLIRIEDDVFEIIGTPEDWNHIIKHRKIVVRKQRKPVKL